MLAIERHNKILNLLDQFGTVRTVDLAYDFSVTDETIRRDLQILADEKKLMRIHGGASSTTGRPTLSSFEERSSINRDVLNRRTKTNLKTNLKKT